MLDAESAVRTVHAGNAEGLVPIAPGDSGPGPLDPSLHLARGNDIGIVVDAQPSFTILAFDMNAHDALLLSQLLLQADDTRITLLLALRGEEGDLQTEDRLPHLYIVMSHTQYLLGFPPDLSRLLCVIYEQLFIYVPKKRGG